MKKFFRKIFSWIPKPKFGIFTFLFKFLVIPAILLLIAVRVFVVKTYERELYFSHEATVQRAEVKVGSEGYGSISAINVNIGDFVHKGDILYKYNNSELDTEMYKLQKLGLDLTLDPVPDGNVSINDFNKNIEFLVRAKIDGVIKEINISVGDYVTKEEITMTMENSEAFVKSFIKVPANFIDKITPGVQAYIKMSNGLQLSGFIKDVAPNYDDEKNLLKVNVLISSKELSRIDVKNIATGTPVEIVVVTSDQFTELVKDFISGIKYSIIKRYLSYEI